MGILWNYQVLNGVGDYQQYPPVFGILGTKHFPMVPIIDIRNITGSCESQGLLQISEMLFT